MQLNGGCGPNLANEVGAVIEAVDRISGGSFKVGVGVDVGTLMEYDPCPWVVGFKFRTHAFKRRDIVAQDAHGTDRVCMWPLRCRPPIQ